MAQVPGRAECVEFKLGPDSNNVDNNKYDAMEEEDKISSSKTAKHLLNRTVSKCSRQGSESIPMTKKASVSSMASVGSLVDSPYIRLMTDVTRKKSSDSSSTGSCASNLEPIHRKRVVSETPSQASVPEDVEADSSKNINSVPIKWLKEPVKRSQVQANVPLALSKSRKKLIKAKKEDKEGGSRIFENYQANILTRAQQVAPSSSSLTVPIHIPCRRSSYNDITQATRPGKMEPEFDPDMGDSSEFSRKSKIRATWSGGNKHKVVPGTSADAEFGVVKKQTGLKKKFGKLFGGR